MAENKMIEVRHLSKRFGKLTVLNDISTSFDAKEVVSIIVWLLMAYVFHGRLATGWRGRKPARLMVLVFGLSLFSIVVVNTLMETHHSFIKP